MLGPLLVQFLRVGWSVYLKPCWEKNLKRKERRERGRGTGKGEERKEGRKTGETDRDRDCKENQQKLSDFAQLVAVVA